MRLTIIDESISLSNQTALYWFTNDLRLQDNITLNAVCRESASIAFIYVFNPLWLTPKNYHQRFVGQHPLTFIIQSLHDLELQLRALGHTLYIIEGNPSVEIPSLVQDNDITLLGKSRQLGWYETKTWQTLQQRLPKQKMVSKWSNQLYTSEHLFGLMQLATPDNDVGSSDNADILQSFSKFRNHVEKQSLRQLDVSTTMVHDLPAPRVLQGNFKTIADLQLLQQSNFKATNASEHSNDQIFEGGEHAAQSHLKAYFTGIYPTTYKRTRNELDGWNSSTKFSPYLANGNLSPRQIWAAVEEFEKTHIKNGDTYWIKFELLWREYFHWQGLQQGVSLYQFQGMASTRPLTTYLPERFQKWCQGNTPYALINACMKQLNATGYMSNRGRQMSASCLVNELGVDWRYGAAYFQEKLIDHDVASNWGNWQYIAGVGVDPRGGRHFNLEKQQQSYDANGEFVAKWQGSSSNQPLDSLDAVGWPCLPTSNTSSHSAKLDQQ
jgi:deoxyribodipyrimidine photo-lyase